jgi:hypothetical protein
MGSFPVRLPPSGGRASPWDWAEYAEAFSEVSLAND